MTDEKYKGLLVFFSVLAAIDIVFCCVFSIFIPLASKKDVVEDVPAFAAEDVLPTISENKIIDVTSPESFSSLIKNMGKLRTEYPELLKIFTAGYSAGGRELMMFKFGNGDKKALIIGGIHAREHISTKYILCCIEDYCRTYYSENTYLGNYDIKALLDEYTLYIIPSANPDGLEIISSRDNCKSGVSVYDLNEYKANKNGVDLNRNFPLAWNSINNGVTRPSAYYFKGYSAGSEPETKALMKLCKENDFLFALSIHIKGNMLYWGDEYNTSHNAEYKAFAEKIATPCKFFMTIPTEKAKDYGGGFENWFRHTYSRPGLCVELMDNEIIIKGTDSSNYKSFYSNVNYQYTAMVFAAAMSE